MMKTPHEILVPSDISAIRNAYFETRRAYGDTLRDVGEKATKRGVVGFIVAIVLLTVLDSWGGDNFEPFRSGERVYGIVGLALVGLVIWISFSGYRSGKLGREWTVTFADFLTAQMELQQLCKSKLGGDWRLVYSNQIAPREKPEASKTVPLKAFQIDGNEVALLGGTYQELKPYEEPILGLEQVFIHDFEENRLLTFGSGKSGMLVSLGGEREVFEFEEYPRNEVDSARDEAMSAPLKRWKKVQSILPFSDSQTEFLASSEGKFLFGCLVLVGVSGYMGWLS